MTDTAADYQTEAVTLAQQTAEYQHATQTATLTGRIFMEAQRCVTPKTATPAPSSLSNK